MTKNFVLWNNTKYSFTYLEVRNSKYSSEVWNQSASRLVVSSGVCRGNPFCWFIQLLENRSWVVGRVCLLRPQCCLGNTLFSFALLHLYPKAKFACYSRYLLTSYMCIPVPCDEKDIFFLVLDLEGLVGPHRTFNFSFSCICGWGIDLDYCDIEWFTLEMDRVPSVILRLHLSTAFWTLVDYEGYSISSMGCFPTVVDIIIIWIKFTHSHLF